MESSNYRDGAYTGGPLNDIRERFRESSLGRDVLKRVVSVIYGSKLPVSVRENRDVLIELIVKGIVHIGVAFFVGCQTKTLLPRTAQVLGIEGDRPMAVKEEVLKQGLDTFLENVSHDSALLGEYGKMYRLHLTAGKTEKLSELADEMIMRGTEKTLEFLSKDILMEITTHWELTNPSQTKLTKLFLVDILLQKIFNLNPPPASETVVDTSLKRKSPEKVSEKSEESRKKPKVAEKSEPETYPPGTILGTERWGIDQIDKNMNLCTLNSHFNKDDILDYLTKYYPDEKRSGKKTVLIRRLLARWKKEES